MIDPVWNRELYVDLLIKCISNTIYKDDALYPPSNGTAAYDAARRQTGSDWPSRAHSMAGIERLRNVADLTQRVLDQNIEGNFVETGVWRGGCCILMKGILAANRASNRKVYLCDSFEGLPPPDIDLYPQDKELDLSHVQDLKISVETVKSNFAAYDLLDDNVVFLKGFFRDTLLTFDPGKLALLRLDGDLYESTILALENLYPRLSPGGYVIVDDYGCIPACAAAVEDYRRQHNIEAPIIQIDWTGVWWQKPGEATPSPLKPAML